MIRRPKPGEDEEDILRMQEEFLKDKNTLPSVQVVNLRKTEQQTAKRPSPSTSTRKPSKYAQSKGLTNAGKRPRTDTSSGSIVGEIVEKNVSESQTKPEQDDDQVYYPKIIPSVLGSIVEKNCDDFVNLDFKPMPPTGFPLVTKRDPKLKCTEKSLTAIQNTKTNVQESMDIDPLCSKFNMENSKPINVPLKSYIISNNDATVIHSENVKVLKEMSEDEILKEQQKLLSSLDPKLVNFIKSKRRPTKEHESATTEVKQEEKMDIESSFERDSLWENDVLSHPQVNKWVNFEKLEKDKLEWMKGIDENKKADPDHPYEARFDFTGYLLPYSMEYTDKTKTLFHHGEEPHRPGYTLMELFELSRSTIIQQRVTALNTIAGILEYHSTGIYKDIIDIPLSKMFFIIRIAMDENKLIILEPALKAMRNLLFNRIDEACLDALIGFEEGNYQPCLENDKSEIEEMESTESELKDFHLAEIDLIAAVLRSDIIQRLYYILENVRPSFNCVQYSIQILIRLARDSIETSNKIIESDHLMKSIVTNFIPNTSINFTFDPNIIYNGKPILAALKLVRILSLQSREIGEILISKYGLLKPISEYINSGVDGTYGLRLQIEAYNIASNLLNYGLGVENTQSLYPLIVNTLYKHVQGTDVFFGSSVLSATHAAVVLQYVNIFLKCNMLNDDNYKHQIYLLLKDGVKKWLMQAAHFDNYTCGHLRLLCSALDCCKTIKINEKITLKFLNDTLKVLSESKGFQIIIDNLNSSSNLLSDIMEKDFNISKNLVSLGGSIIDSTQKVLPVLGISSPIPLLVSLFQLLNVVNDEDIGKLYLKKVLNYLDKFSKKNPNLNNNWFTRMEIELMFNIIKLAIQSNVTESCKDLIYSVASKLCYILRVDKKIELEYLFHHIIFNKQWFTAERLLNLVSITKDDGLSKALTTVEDIRICYSKVVNTMQLNKGGNIILKQWQEPVLPRDWIYLPILSLYSKSQEIRTTPEVVGDHANKLKEQQAIEKELIIRCCLEWILFNEICFPDLLDDIDVTDRFCRIMCVYLSDNSLFLDDKINLLLKKCVQIIFKKSNKFNFDKQLMGLNNFQDLYTQFLEQFQSVSYGDSIFAACVLVPLAQRHNVKWRKLLWSEYAGCLRALDCPESYLCYELNDYLYPEETDESLIKSYFRALSSNLLRPGTIAYKIAQHHVNNFKKK
ncbi:RNA polymerase II-associated protein 1 [Vanessa cardui]|uniref:RNA polymerase II-associated protein 1 n=1 Tax=Vanessa cardui TaxID=171605 RepID=UPI001F12E24A|nr:RNA polymerase II-associated protein 1 [Vanessa cardui]